jgi:hypothetical protein
VLDKGQEDDWFNTPFIVWFSIIAAVALVSFVIWEWNHKHPVVDVRLFKNRNFAASNIMMLILGVSLFGTTVLLPAVHAGHDGVHRAAGRHGALAGRVRGDPPACLSWGPSSRG